VHRHVAAALVISAALIAPPAAAAAAPRCLGAGAPTRAAAWRAYVPPRTPIRPRPDAAASGLTSRGRWLLVVGAAPGRHGSCWVEVRLERRPNSAHGWVVGARVRLKRTGWRIEVSRARRRVTLRDAGRTVARWSVVVGNPSTQTPGGLFAIQDSYRSPPGSFEGSWILTLTAHSEVLKRFDGGDGRVALHGRGGASLADPLGTAASHGCIRLDNHAIGEIVRRIGRPQLPGVPVEVT
jgi:L,D-transpeptidase-like protein